MLKIWTAPQGGKTLQIALEHGPVQRNSMAAVAMREAVDRSDPTNHNPS
jgi:hypothetical protein